MAHFAKLNSTNTVVEVVVVSNDAINNLPFPESESVGIVFLESLFGKEENVTWKQTSYNQNFRKNFGAVGYTYNDRLDAFIPSNICPSSILNEETCLWEHPVPYPTDGSIYNWDEPTLSWVKVEL
jgi:hypothetical protein